MGRFLKANPNVAWLVGLGVTLTIAVWGFTREDSRAEAGIVNRVVALETWQSGHQDFVKMLVERMSRIEDKLDRALEALQENNAILREYDVPKPTRPRRPPPR